MEVVEHSDSSKIARTGDRLSVDLAMIVLEASPQSSEAATTSGMSALARLALSPPTREASSPGRTITTAISVGGKAHMQRESTRAKAPPCPVVVRKQTPCRIFLCSKARFPTTRNNQKSQQRTQLFTAALGEVGFNFNSEKPQRVDATNNVHRSTRPAFDVCQLTHKAFHMTNKATPPATHLTSGRRGTDFWITV